MPSSLEQLLRTYKNLGLNKNPDHIKNSLHYVTYHSTAIEGCSLSLAEVTLLLEKGITSKGKPQVDRHMVEDHHKALSFVLNQAEKKQRISIDFLKNAGQLH